MPVYKQQTVSVIIPAFNEEASIGHVINAIPAYADEIIVVNNRSTDQTVQVAKNAGAIVVNEDRKGYGAACLAGIKSLKNKGIIVFLDGDFSDFPEDMDELVEPVASGEAAMIIGSRNLGQAEKGSLTAQAIFGNWLACLLIKWFWKTRFTDLGPFRAIHYDALMLLNMQDRNYGWTVEMQVKAAIAGLRTGETPVRYRKRIGNSKISGTVKGVLGAGIKILGTIFLAKSGLLPGWQAEAEDHLIIMSRYPTAGKTKTRLIPALGAKGAALQQAMMTEHCLRWARDIQQHRRLSIEVRYAGSIKGKWKQWLGSGLIYTSQGPGDLGYKMAEAFKAAFDTGKKRVLMVGTDCAEMTAELALQGFRMLEKSDLCLGPAHDGGYYTIGLSAFHSELFKGMEWGSAHVWQQTMKIVEKEKISYQSLPVKTDIDRPEDLTVWTRVRQEGAGHHLSLSVIIPVLNEEQFIGPVIEQAWRNHAHEVIVVDGGSTDRTVEAAKKHKAKVVASSPGRAVQMNRGAAQATGALLLFLHGDTMLPDGAEITMQEMLKRPGVIGGAFRLGIMDGSKSEKIIACLANLRSLVFELPYGDQGIFISRRQFKQSGGYREIPIMEDYELVKRLVKCGKMGLARSAVATSGRRWKQLGIIRTTIINQLILAGYYLGVPLSLLAKLYRLAK